jgi:hypothetical protein
MPRRLIFVLTIILISINLSYGQVIELPFQEFPANVKYLNKNLAFNVDKTQYIINSNRELRETLGSELDNFDFFRHTIIGVQGHTPGCRRPIVEFKVVKDIKNKKYIIEAIVVQQGTCKANHVYKRLIYTEKFQSDYNVEFKTSTRY